MKITTLNFSTSLIINTALYLLYRNMSFCPGDPFLLYIGIILLSLYKFNDQNLSNLFAGFIFTNTGIAQIIIANKLISLISNKLLIISILGITLLIIFAISCKKTSSQEFIHIYWPFLTGLTLIIISIIYNLKLEEIIWENISLYWPSGLLILVIFKKKSLLCNKLE